MTVAMVERWEKIVVGAWETCEQASLLGMLTISSGTAVSELPACRATSRQLAPRWKLAVFECQCIEESELHMAAPSDRRPLIREGRPRQKKFRRRRHFHFHFPNGRDSFFGHLPAKICLLKCLRRALDHTSLRVFRLIAIEFVLVADIEPVGADI